MLLPLAPTLQFIPALNSALHQSNVQSNVGRPEEIFQSEMHAETHFRHDIRDLEFIDVESTECSAPLFGSPN